MSRNEKGAKAAEELPTITAVDVVGTLRCANTDCNEPVLQAHTFSIGVFRVLACPKCGRGSEYRSMPTGWTCALLPLGFRRRGDKKSPNAPAAPE